MLPGISAEDCLFADLGVDPARMVAKVSRLQTSCCRSEPSIRASSLILWQIGLLGQEDYRTHYATAGLPILVEHLTKIYGPLHLVTIYEAALYPVCTPVTLQVALQHLSEARIGPYTTIYVPPIGGVETDPELAARLYSVVSR